MVYLIGVDHLIQYNGPVPGYLIVEFINFLSSQVKRYKISVIAEEFNKEFLHDVLGATEATAEKAAEISGIKHIFCDPDERERLILGIPYYAEIKESIKKRYGIRENFIIDNMLRTAINEETAAEAKKYWDIREKFWLDKIRNMLMENIIFICGHEHVYRFREHLVENNIDVDVIDEYWRRDVFSDYTSIGLT